jgi:hypothetical protein
VAVAGGPSGGRDTALVVERAHGDFGEARAPQGIADTINLLRETHVFYDAAPGCQALKNRIKL